MVAGYEVFVSESPDAVPPPRRANNEDVEQALASLQDAFVGVNFLTPDNQGPRFAEWRELFGRAGLTEREAHMLLALARKIRNLGRIADESKDS